MKVKVYMRVGYDVRRRALKVAATTKPTNALLTRADSPMPTVAFAVEFDIADELFRRAEHVIATTTIPPESATIVGEVSEP